MGAEIFFKMSIQEILDLEKNNTNSIYFFKEGIFYRCYERSAFRFVKHIATYKFIKKHFKNVGQDVVYIGFPTAMLDKHLEKAQPQDNITHSEKMIEWKGFTDTEDFAEWKNAIPIDKIEEQPVNKNNHDILDKIRKYPVMNKTPFETQAFVLTLQNELNGYV